MIDNKQNGNFIYLVEEMRKAQMGKNKQARMDAERRVDDWLAKEAEERQQPGCTCGSRNNYHMSKCAIRQKEAEG